MGERIRDKLFPEEGKARNRIRIMIRFFKYIFSISFWKRTRRKIKRKGKRVAWIEFNADLRANLDPYVPWMKNNEPNRRELRKQRKKVFDYNPKISIIVPMYNTDEYFFEDLVENMIDQTYSNWELCLADGSPEKNDKLEKICKKDSRIIYKFLGENKGIAGNTNEALKLATGDFIGLLDHDDMLPIFSLYEVVKCINNHPDAEFIYSDEDKFVEKGGNRFNPYFKSDFSPDTLRANNYICHLSIFKKELMEKLGGFRSEYDGAQDYDIILRMSETTNNIYHIPKILYHWRVHEQSTSLDGGAAKPYAYESGLRAIQDHINRLGLKGTVEHGKTLGTYKINYEIIKIYCT